ncbi:MAG: dienelactone hydrolase family protein [Burkholderiales bacterium]
MAARSVIRIAASIAALAATGAAALPPPERVTFPSLDQDTPIEALLFRPPDASPGKPVPLVIAAHGCGGMYSDRPDRRDQLSERSIAWTGMFLADGYAVLWPDSFNSRGRRSVCLVKRGEPSITPVTRRLDILGALAFAQAQPGIDRKRIALVGWSHGGSTTLAAVNGRDARIARFLAAAPAPSPFVAAVAFYPGCVVSLRKGGDWMPSVPLRIDTGELDDWTPSTKCVELGEDARKRGADMKVTVYPGAYHGFDAPRGKVTVWKEVTTGANPDMGVTLGPDPAAREAATRDVRAFLRERFQ